MFLLTHKVQCSGSEETLGQTMKLFLFLSLSLLAPWSEGKFVKRSLASYPLAKCNDGTPANYYYSDDLLHATKLVINLQGGGACYDKQGCQNRCADAFYLSTLETENTRKTDRNT